MGEAVRRLTAAVRETQEVRGRQLEAVTIAGLIDAAIAAHAKAAEGEPSSGTAETGWVIECEDSDPAAPLYWAGKDWSEDHMTAVRFARKIDAQRLHFHLMPDTDVRICAHEWSVAVRALEAGGASDG